MVGPGELREILRAREPLAPDPGEVFAGADRRYRRVRARRRVAGASAAVVVITAGLSVGLGLARQHGAASAPQVQAAAAPSDTVVVPSASLPFVLGGDVSAARLVRWTIGSHAASAEYLWYGQTYTVSVSDTDPEEGYDERTYDINGAKAPLRWFPDSTTQQLSWQMTPDKWVSVTTDRNMVAAGETAVFAESVRLGPNPVPTLIRSLRVPAQLTVGNRSSTGSGETLNLCPANASADTPTDTPASAGKPLDCVLVTAGKGPEWQQRVAADFGASSPERNVVVDGIVLRVSADGRTVARQFTDWSIVVQRATGEESVLPSIAASVFMN